MKVKEEKDKKRKENTQSGVITVEVCTILFIFTFAMLAILSIIHLIQTQVFVQNAVNQTAKEVSQYSYLLYRTGYVEMVQKQNIKSEELKEKYAQLKADPDGTMEQLLKALYNGETTVKAEADSIFSGFLGMVYSGAFGGINQGLLGGLTKNILKDYCGKFSSNDILENMGVEDGMDGVQITVEYCTDTNDKNKFKITADYTYVINYPFLDMLQIPCRACASTAIWGGGE